MFNLLRAFVVTQHRHAIEEALIGQLVLRKWEAARGGE
jgi:hypothetical protein